MIKIFLISTLLIIQVLCLAQYTDEPYFILRSFYDGDMDQQASDYIADYEFGFYNNRIGSAAATSNTILDSIRVHNELTDSILRHEYGSNWKLKYERLSDSLWAEFDLAQRIIQSDSSTIQKIESQDWFDLNVRPMGVPGWYEFLFFKDDELLSTVHLILVSTERKEIIYLE